MWLNSFELFVLGTTYTLAYDLSGVLSGNRLGSVPLGRSLGDGELDVEGICSAPGTTCQDCAHSVTCVALPVGWLKVPLSECVGNETCNARLGGCSKDPVPECEVATLKYEHVCEQVGIFPDAFDCRKFHLCSPPTEDPVGRPAEHRAALCPLHYAYDPHTAQCSIRLKHGQCDQKPVPECKKIGQSDVLPGSPNHYFICLSKKGELYPQVFICPHGWFFWGGFCRPEPEPSIEENLVTNQELGATKQEPGVTKQESKATKVTNDVTNQESKATKESKKSKKAKKAKQESAESSDEVSKPKIEDEFALDWFTPRRPKQYPADTFLADRYDFSHLEPGSDDEEPSMTYENPISFETGLSVFE